MTSVSEIQAKLRKHVALLINSQPNRLKTPECHQTAAASSLCWVFVADANALRGLVHHLLDALGRLPAHPQGLVTSASSWQCQAASLVVLLSETVFGASSAWLPTSWLGADVEGISADSALALADLVGEIQEEFVRTELWGVQTSNLTLTDDENAHHLTPQAGFCSACHTLAIVSFNHAVVFTMRSTLNGVMGNSNRLATSRKS